MSDLMYQMVLDLTTQVIELKKELTFEKESRIKAEDEVKTIRAELLIKEKVFEYKLEDLKNAQELQLTTIKSLNNRVVEKNEIIADLTLKNQKVQQELETEENIKLELAKETVEIQTQLVHVSQELKETRQSKKELLNKTELITSSLVLELFEWDFFYSQSDQDKSTRSEYIRAYRAKIDRKLARLPKTSCSNKLVIPGDIAQFLGLFSDPKLHRMVYPIKVLNKIARSTFLTSKIIGK